MPTTTAPPRSRSPERLLAAMIVAAASLGIGAAALPSVLLVVNPPDPWFCPAIWPLATSCVPGAHLVVVGVAVVVLVSAWLAADLSLRRTRTVAVRGCIIAALAVLALVAWSAAREPQPYLAAWIGLVG